MNAELTSPLSQAAVYATKSLSSFDILSVHGVDKSNGLVLTLLFFCILSSSLSLFCLVAKREKE